MARLEGLHLFTDVLIKVYFGYFSQTCPAQILFHFVPLRMIFVYVSSKVECMILSRYILFCFTNFLLD